MNIELGSYIIIYVCSLIGLFYSILCAYRILVIHTKPIKKSKHNISLKEKELEEMKEIAYLIEEGSNVFLIREYFYILIFTFIFALIIFLLAEYKFGYFYTTIAFIIGSQTSLIAGYIGMKIATLTNIRTTYNSCYSLGKAFYTSYLGGCVMGFFLVSCSIIVLTTLILIYKTIHFTKLEIININDWSILFEGIAGYGLGGSSVALFCRVGGGIYTKAADVGADLVSKIDKNLNEDNKANPAVVADNVGDNVGDIAGMGSDLFGSMAESLCSALLVGATSEELTIRGSYLYPILIVSIGILICIITTELGLLVSKDNINNYFELEETIIYQLIISTILLIPIIVIISNYCLPEKFTLGFENSISYKPDISKDYTVICPLFGLISGLLTGISTYYYTSPYSNPVKSLKEGCKQGPAINIILGISLGYFSNIIPTILISFTIYISFYIAGIYGIALAAIGMLSNLPVCLAIDGYGPISDNAGGIAEMCKLDNIRNITDELDAAGNTTAAIGKGFAIGSASLCAFSLYGAFLTKAELKYINIMTPLTMSGILVGAMIPLLFSALTMKAVGNAAETMIQTIKITMNNKEYDENNNIEPASNEEINKCIKVATDSSLNYMILPGVIVIFTPLLMGLLFGALSVAGLLLGIIISGIQVAISSSNSGGAWDNCKKSIKKQGIDYNYLEFLYNEQSLLNRKIIKLEEKVKRKNNLDISFNLLENKEENLNYKHNIESYKKRLLEVKSDIDIYEELIKRNNNKFPRLNCLNNNNNNIFSEYDKKLIKELNNKVNILNNKAYYKKAEKASIIGDTVGDPLKDTSGPSLNILIKLSSIISVVFANFYLKTGYLQKYFYN